MAIRVGRQAAIDYFHLSKECYSITPTEYRNQNGQNKERGDTKRT